MLIFDFDGVLLDSLDEVAVTAFNVVSATPARSLEDLPSGYLELFRKNRYLVQPAADFPPFATWCINNCSNPNTVLAPAEYLSLLKQDTTPWKERQRSFFSARKEFVQDEPKIWISLNKPIQPIWNELKSSADAVIILTNKNQEAVLDVTKQYGLELDAQNVYAADTGSKLTNFRAIQERFGKNKHRFIDDSVKNLIDLRAKIDSSELDLLFADWGYCGPKDAQTAAEHGFSVYSQELTIKDFKSE
jgi:FMN phosphatase YigB (HAD superfamily)